jgi:hypothetical protein
LEGDSLLATGAKMAVLWETLDGSGPQPVIERAKAISMVSNSLSAGLCKP